MGFAAVCPIRPGDEHQGINLGGNEQRNAAGGHGRRIAHQDSGLVTNVLEQRRPSFVAERIDRIRRLRATRDEQHVRHSGFDLFRGPVRGVLKERRAAPVILDAKDLVQG